MFTYSRVTSILIFIYVGILVYCIHNTLFRGIPSECLSVNNFIAHFQDNIYIHREHSLD